MPQEQVITFKPTKYPFPTCRCPACGGFGHHSDGYFNIFDKADGEIEVRSKTPTKCEACSGLGLVRYSKIESVA